MEDFIERYKAKVLDVKGAPECMKISGFMHGITHPELIKRLYEKILRSMDEMYRVTTSFLQGEVAAFSHSRKKAPTPWRQPEGGNKPNFKKGFKNKQRSDEKPDRFSLLTKTLKENFVLEKGKFKAPPPMVNPAKKRDPNKYCEFHADTGHNTNECMQLRKQIEEMIKSPSQHNGIIGRTGIRKIRVVPSTAHEMLKFPVEGGTVTLRSSRVILMECAMISGPSTQHPVTSQVLEEKIKVAIHPEYPEQTIAIGSTLTEKGRKELCALLRQNLDVFAWKPADMTGVPRHIAEHRLNVREGCLPIRQKKRGQAPERNKAIQEEVEKLVDAGIMKEVHYHSWLSNPVMVKKHDGSWRMCVDFKDLNKACPKDGYPLPEIDWKVESLCGYPFKCFLDAYKGYHQIKMAEEDEEKTAFITSQGIFCYSKMSFGLKNARATYQRLVDREFQKAGEYYTPMEKLVLALLSASKRLKRYFQAHTIVVIKNQPIRQLLSNSEITGRMLKWKFELEGYDIQYRPRISIKGQILADFIVERPEEESLNELMVEPEELPEPWTLFTDGSSCIDGSRARLILTNSEGVEFTYAMRFRFEATNNEAVYEALIAGLRIIEQIGVKNLQANVDSRLVANQVNGSYVAKESGMVQYLEKVKTLTSNFKGFFIKKVSRSETKKEDSLSKIASTSFAHISKQVLVEELNEKSINKKEVLAIAEEEGHTWMTPICEYLIKEILPKDKKKARAVRRKASRYAVINGTLYKKSFLGPWLRCVRPLQANYVLREIHDGSCSMHFGPRSVVAKSIQTGYYWLTMHRCAETNKGMQ
ncbi:reverse transcriptase domain-containing protein [Tanacetum coccineum]